MKNTYAIFYNKYPFCGHKVNQEIFDTEFVLLMVLEAENLEDAYWQMQGENWSPNGEAREIIKQFGLSHTTMMVGDIICDTKTNRFYRVDMMGF